LQNDSKNVLMLTCGKVELKKYSRGNILEGRSKGGSGEWEGWEGGNLERGGHEGRVQGKEEREGGKDD